MKLYYQFCETDDPEERFEDAAMWKALHDEYGDELKLIPNKEKVPTDGYFFGRGRRFQIGDAPKLLVNDYLPYWKDPAFLKYAGRSFELCNFDQAEAAVKALHTAGKGAFFKATQQKLLTMKLPVGINFRDELEDMAYSFLDQEECIMIQELVPMRFERRFVVINRSIVTHAPCAVHLTPLDYPGMVSAHFTKPTDRHPALFSDYRCEQMAEAVDDIAANMATDHAIVDMAYCDEDVICVEFNPARIGQFGLYANSVRAIAKASRGMLPDVEMAAA